MKKKLHMIGHAHIDPVWLWRWTEGFQEVKATFRSALDRMNEDPGFTFIASSSIFYEWVEQSDPAMFEEIKARVAEGRWELVGGWVIEPDCNIPSGESFARQGLYGQRYFKKAFGKTTKVGFNADSFGHNGTLPQIFNQQGIENYVFLRPGDHEKDTPRTFRWQSPDGAELLCYRIPFEYNTWGDDLRMFCNRLYPEIIDGDNELILFYGVGNHGGGPTKENIRNIHTINAEQPDIDHAFSTPAAYFDAARASGKVFPLIQDDLQHHASGCYSVHSGVKKRNRHAENALAAAETFSAIASVAKSIAYPNDFERAWKNVLFNQFHDILAGTSLISGYDDARNMYGEAVSIAERNLNSAIQAISWGIKIPIEDNTDMYPIVAFNPHSWGGKMVCEAEVRFWDRTECRLIDDEGNPVPVQFIQSESTAFMKRVLFVADLPAMGYRTYRLYLTAQQPPYEVMPVQNTTIENDWLRLTVNPETGNLSSLFDKKQNVEMLRREGARLAIIEDQSDTWAHGVFKFDNEIGNMKPVYVRVVEEGAVRSVIRVRYQYNDSYVSQDFRLYRDLPHVEVALTADWREPQTMLKVKFPVDLNNAVPTYEIPFGSITKTANGEEEAGQSWVDFSGTHAKTGASCGLALANTAKYSYSFDADEMGMTILRNAPFGHHDPWKLDPNLEYEMVDHGVQTMTYALLPHAGLCAQSESTAIRVAREINTRPTIILETFREEGAPQRMSFLEVSAPEIIVTAVKEAEDGDGIIVRAYNSQKQPLDATINVQFMNKSIRASFGASEIKTFKLAHGTCAVTEVNLLEW